MSLLKVYIERQQVDSVRSRIFREGDAPVYQQKIWVYKGGSRFPIELEIRLPDGVQLYPEGDYLLDISTNLVGDKYLAPSFAPFSSYTLTPVSEDVIAAFDKQSKQLFDLLRNPISTVNPVKELDPVPEKTAASPLFKSSATK